MIHPLPFPLFVLLVLGAGNSPRAVGKNPESILGLKQEKVVDSAIPELCCCPKNPWNHWDFLWFFPASPTFLCRVVGLEGKRLLLFLGCPQLIPHISEIPDQLDIP